MSFYLFIGASCPSSSFQIPLGPCRSSYFNFLSPISEGYTVTDRIDPNVGLKELNNTIKSLAFIFIQS